MPTTEFESVEDYIDRQIGRMAKFRAKEIIEQRKAEAAK